jgi:hypothetical protein
MCQLGTPMFTHIQGWLSWAWVTKSQFVLLMWIVNFVWVRFKHGTMKLDCVGVLQTMSTTQIRIFVNHVPQVASKLFLVQGFA